MEKYFKRKKERAGGGGGEVDEMPEKLLVYAS